MSFRENFFNLLRHMEPSRTLCRVRADDQIYFTASLGRCLQLKASYWSRCNISNVSLLRSQLQCAIKKNIAH